MSDELERRVDEAIRNDGILSVAQGLREYYEADIASALYSTD